LNEEHKKFIEAFGAKTAKKNNDTKQTYVAPNYDPYMQLRGLRQFVQCLRMESAGNASSIAIAKNTQVYNQERGGDNYADDCPDAMYFDATVSGAIVASLAQYFEGLFKYEFYRLSQSNHTNIKLNSRRYKGIETAISKKVANKIIGSTEFKKRVSENYWDPHYYIDDIGNCQKSIVKGISELCGLYDINKSLPNDFEEVLTAIFQYRNYVMHNGVEWEDKEISKFKTNIERLSFDAFQWSTRNGVESIAFISDKLIDHTLSLCECFLEHVWFCELDG
jgi:hypothetical protein